MFGFGKMQVLVAEFATAHDIVDAAGKVYEAGYRKFDAHTPFPVHGLDKAMKIPVSKLGWIVFAHGLTGCLGGFLLQWGTSSQLYPMIIGGKPYNSFQAWVIICFELTILLSAFGSVLGMLALNGLPRLAHPILTHPGFRRFSDDRFFLSVESTDARFDPVKTKELLERVGGTNVALVEG